MEKFRDIERYHEDLKRLFAEHQERLVERAFELSDDALQRFERALVVHEREEEENLLPVFSLVVGEPIGGSAEVFRQEHRKLEKMLYRVQVAMQELRSDPGTQKILDLLEKEAQFKNLLEHHFLREHNVLFTELDRLVEVGERARLLSGCTPRVQGMEEALVASTSREIRDVSPR
jgi:hemerythrin-like domain-containing protein